MHLLEQKPETLPLFSPRTGTDDPCAYKHGGNHNSILAHEAAKSNKEARYLEILALLEEVKEAGLTGKEIARRLGVAFNCISGRFAELLILKRIVRLRLKREGSGVLVLPQHVAGRV